MNAAVGTGHGTRRYVVVVAAALILALAGTAAAAQTPGRVVSTSGVPHTDVADYRASPYWRPRMPRGANTSWRTYLDTSVGQITTGADLVLHTGDMVEGRWGQDVDGAGVFGPVGTYKQKSAAVQLAGSTYYRFYRRYWSGLDVLWAQGDHEVGDLTSTAPLPGTFRYRAHEQWNVVWRRHFGSIRHADRRGTLGVITLDPIVKWKRGLLPRIPAADFDWLRDRVRTMRLRGVRWIIVQSEIPAIGPNAGRASSRLLLENGDRLWRLLDRLDIDLLLTGEFHADTTRSTDDHTPVQVVHGGRWTRAAWVTIDVYPDRLDLTWWESIGSIEGRGTIWNPSSKRAPNKVAAGTPEPTGKLTIHQDGSLSNRTGSGREGTQ